MNSGKLTVVDVRTEAEFVSGHAEGAINVPVGDLMGRLEELRKIDGTIVLCCASGGRSAMAKMMLAQQGFNNLEDVGPWYNARNLVKI